MTRLEDHLMRLREDDFLSLASLYLGPVSMPYNRHNLISRLTGFFSDESVRANLIASVKPEEAGILSLVRVFAPVRPEKLLKLFDQSVRQEKLHCLSSLTKRTLLLTDENGALDLNSGLDYSSVLSQEVFAPILKKEEREICLRDSLKAVVSLILTERTGANMKAVRRLAKARAGCFPRLEKEETERLFTLFISAALDWKLIRAERDHFIADREKTERFLSLPLVQIMSALTRYLTSSDLARTFSAFASSFTKEGLASVFSALYCDSSDMQKFSRLIDEYYFLYEGSQSETDSEEEVIVTNDLLIRTHSLKRDSRLFLFTCPVMIDNMMTLSLTAESVCAGFDLGLSVQDIICELWPDGKADRTVESRLRQWKEKYDEFSFTDSVCLETNIRNARIIDQLPLLQIHIIKKLSDTVYLMRKDSEDQWRRILVYSGFDTLSATQSFCRAEESKETQEVPDESAEDLLLPACLPPVRKPCPSDYKSVLAAEIEERCGKDDRADYLELLESGILVSSSQICDHTAFRTGRSASGFSFQQKMLIILESRKHPDWLYEIKMPDASGIYHIEKVEAKGKDCLVTLRGSGAQSFTVSADKIFFIREILY